jgi:pimeloyl-ACP methyl ester carboxylesterase
VRSVRTRDGADLHTVVTGPEDADVTVVLAHGWTLRHDAWSHQARALTDGDGAAGGPSTRVVRHDHRGHGRSSSGSLRPWTIDLLADDLAEVLDAVAPTGPVVLGGHSMGGMTIMALAAARPELFGPAGRVRGVALVGTSAGGLAPAGRGVPPRLRVATAVRGRLFGFGLKHPAAFTRGRRLLPGPHRAGHLAVVRRGLFGPAAPREEVDRCARMIHATHVDALCGYYPAIAAHDKAGALGALANVPVRIVVGEVDRLTPVAHSRRLADELPHAVLRVEPGCGHMVLMERPDAVTVPLRELVEAAAGS